MTPRFSKSGCALAVALACSMATGCSDSRWGLMPNKLLRTPATKGPEDTMVLRGGELQEPPATPEDEKAAAELAGGHELYRQGNFTGAEKVFHKIAENKKNSPRIAEEARYYEAECLRRQKRYPKAADTYNKLLMDFPGAAHRDQAVQHMFDIANYWLEDTRAEMHAQREKEEGKRWFTPVSWFHWDKTKPVFDEEGRAIEKLEQVSYNGVNSGIGDHALFLLGSVKFYREEYVEADHYFSALVERHPHSSYAPKAVELAIISKHMSTGGSDYDGRKVAEARNLCHKAIHAYPELGKNKKDFLDRQLAGITHQQAEKEFKIAEFYRRTRHPGSAYFYYGIVKRRYPGTPFAEKAEQRLAELDAERRQSDEAKPSPPAGTPGTSPEQAPSPRTLPDLNAQELPPQNEAQEETPRKKFWNWLNR
ncbi:MAG: tetratricopeptide repeat protein [Gemmataceae bacterium]